jgi:hypothetical protein
MCSSTTLLRRLISSRTQVARLKRLDGRNEWGKRRDIIVCDRLPFKAEPPGSVLARAEITALDAFYSRNHGPFPDIAPAMSGA